MQYIVYEDDLDIDGLDWLRVRITTDRGEVVNFTVQYETVVAGRRLAVIRSDCAHGFPHRDVLDRHGAVVTKEALPDRLALSVALDTGIADIKENWRRHRRRFFGDTQ